MTALRLHFEGPASWSELRTAAGAVAETLGCAAGGWTQVEHETLEDRNHTGHAFRNRWTHPDASIQEEVASGAGNPRDGYGYDLHWRLELAASAGPVTIELRADPV